jgi:glycosyltransferase involved in cell wall biosynthesis
VNIHAQVTTASAGEVIPVDIERTARALERWMGDQTARQAAGEQARLFALEHYDWRGIAQDWRNHYAALIGEKAGGLVR